ncbi:pre-rRNA-processing protein TSR2 homolog [Centruroides vittatus]|uniref:pre-rRNA-processing protein TSR2 homolog n=1 Tax=Centruroides vittatus TaxID=120091 RepID=UPI0035100180
MAASNESVFHFGIKNVLKNWTALQMAIEHGMGGPESHAKELWLADVIEEFFNKNDNLLPEEVEEYIEDILSYEFNTIADDGSVLEVSKKFCQYFEFCQNKQESKILESCRRNQRSVLQNNNQKTELGENPDNSMQSLPQIQNLTLNSEPEPDVSFDGGGGWMLVTNHRRK